jgi:glycosyltransferase involved in cell wall biosynthesis
VSCAYARPEKRLHLIPECLRSIERRIEWTHIGDGAELPKLIERAKCLPPHVTARFVGKLNPEEVPRFYVDQSFDLFVNVSESEGIPVSAMEAMASGIPVLATSVGGTPELVGSGAGRLLPANFTPSQFLMAIQDIASLSAPARDEMRRRCHARISDMFDSATNSRSMAELILSL